jgi:contractile injection system tube protein
MPDNTSNPTQNGAANLAKAMLQELDAGFANVVSGHDVTVQFNPESLKVVFTNQIQQPSGPGDQRGPGAQLYVASGATKLTVNLWFDVPSQSEFDDVRRMTQKVAYFIKPKENSNPKMVPATRFVWGTFQFDGVVESMEESLEFFSPDGRPLRAAVALGMSRQEFTFGFNQNAARPPNTPTPGTRPLTPAASNQTVQGMAAAQGKAAGWQGIAAANNIENPRLVPLGTLVDLNLGVGAGLSAGVNAGASLGLNLDLTVRRGG